MSVIRLRTLTRKSKFGFGKHAERTVQFVLDRKNKDYISWVYYNNANITFTDDILDEVIPLQAKRIEKPGKNPDLHTPGISQPINTLRTFKSRAHADKERRIALRNFRNMRDSRWFNKGANAWKNQGH